MANKFPWALLLVALPAHAELRPPTDIELQALYCLAVVQDVLNEPNSAQNPEYQYLLDLESRLQAYTLPRILALDPLSMTVASKRADVDFAATIKYASSVDWRGLQQCAWACTKQFKEKPGRDACINRCEGQIPEAVSRVRRCHSVDWLPF